MHKQARRAQKWITFVTVTVGGTLFQISCFGTPVTSGLLTV